MPEPQQRHLRGLEYLDAVTTLLQRRRLAHPTKGTFQAAEIQFWWSVPRPTDSVPQLFWFDDDGRPEAAVTVTDFGDGTSLVYDEPTLVVLVMPDATTDWVDHVVERGLAHFAEYGIDAVELEVDRVDDVLRGALSARGFVVKDDGTVECWLDAASRPEISPLADGYRLCSRSETKPQRHHLADQRRPNIEERLQQTSLYRSEFDLVVLDGNDQPAAYGMFWLDPVTATGVVEPMRTLDAHQQRGLARHILTSGIDRLVHAGAERISIGFEPGNPASRHLYLSVGFEPYGQTDLLFGPTGQGSVREAMIST